MIHSLLLSETYFGSTVTEYLLFCVALGVGAVLGWSLSFLYRQRLRRTAKATETKIDDIILHALGRPVILLGLVLGASVSQYVLTPIEPFRTVLSSSVEILVVVTITWIVIRLTDGVIETYLMSYVGETDSKLDEQLVPIVSRITNIAIVSVAAIVILDTWGYDVTAVITSFGVVGVAVAFAARETMADVFGGVHILSAKPFLVDDIVDIEGTTGTVEQIGLRTTRIRDFDNRVVMLPNATIANSEVRNISSEPARRVKTYLGLSYDTTPAELTTAIDLIVDTVNRVDGIDTDQTGAWFWDYGDSAMRIRVDYHIAARDRWKNIRGTVNHDIQQAFEEAGFEMAFPTRTVHIEHSNDKGIGPEENVEQP
jgi:MscS family membrane protein